MALDLRSAGETIFCRAQRHFTALTVSTFAPCITAGDMLINVLFERSLLARRKYREAIATCSTNIYRRSLLLPHDTAQFTASELKFQHLRSGGSAFRHLVFRRGLKPLLSGSRPPSVSRSLSTRDRRLSR